MISGGKGNSASRLPLGINFSLGPAWQPALRILVSILHNHLSLLINTLCLCLNGRRLRGTEKNFITISARNASQYNCKLKILDFFFLLSKVWDHSVFNSGCLFGFPRCLFCHSVQLLVGQFEDLSGFSRVEFSSSGINILMYFKKRIGEMGLLKVVLLF